MEFYGKWMQDEYRDTHPLVFHTAAPGHIHDDPVAPLRMLEDLAGLKIRVPSQALAATLEALGAVPVGMPISDVYEALSARSCGRRVGALVDHAALSSP